MNLIRTEIAADLRKLADEIENSDADKIVHYVRLLSHDVLIPGTPVVGDRVDAGRVDVIMTNVPASQALKVLLDRVFDSLKMTIPG
jgi:hypothetical protein